MNKIKFTKKVVLDHFKQFLIPKTTDKLAIVLAWNDYVNSLEREGRLSLKQINRWTNPFEYRKF